MVTVHKTIKALSTIINPAGTKSIVEEGIVQNVSVADSTVSFDLLIRSTSSAIAHEIKLKAEEAVKQIEGVEKVVSNVITPSDIKTGHDPSYASPLNKVKNIIAVSSAKGGVGKSTIAVHLAKELAARDYKVGLVDVDIYGPSIPTLFQLTNIQIYTNEKKQLIPVEHDQLKLMSFGFLFGDQPAVMRGPVVTRYIQQILLNTDWGELDYLLIDMPPGTGDVQLTITQSIRLTGAVIVTTPHTLSLIDVARGIIMFEKVAVPIIGIVENMAYLEVQPGTKQYIFGESFADKLANRFGVEILSEVPILEVLSRGTQKSDEPPAIKSAVDAMLTRTEQIKSSALDIPTIKFDESKVQFSWSNGEHWVVKNFALRLISQDALSVDEMTGKQMLKPEDIRKDIAARDVTPLGNYGVGITWNDGHASAIYTYKNIRQIASITSS